MLYRLIYASQCSRDLGPDDVKSIVAQARRNNERLDITGFLAFNSQHFLQVLEGSREALSALYSRLTTDPRHHSLTLMEMRAIQRREFGSWCMEFVPDDAQHAALYLRHSDSSRLKPSGLDAAAALALFLELAQLRGQSQEA